MKLYVWDDVLTDYTSGIMFAVAQSLEEARAMLRDECSFADDIDIEPKVYDLTEPVCRVVWGGG